MSSISIHFHGELNAFLPGSRRDRGLEQTLDRKTSIKDLIESFNVPHTEVQAIDVNDQAVDFSYIVRPGDRIAVYATPASLSVGSNMPLRPTPPVPPRFVVDCNLGRLARYLRLLGFDALYSNRYQDSEVAGIAQRDERIVLTRDRFLLQHRIIVFGYFVRDPNPLDQLREVIRRFDLASQITPFSRCTRCNGELVEVAKADILHRLEPKTILYYHQFRHCPDCDRIYWPGSHYERALALVRELIPVA